MMVDGIVTYEQAAGSLPLRTRWAIEDGIPCTGGNEHHWDTEDAEFLRRARIGSIERFPRRECLRCHITWVNPDYRQKARP